MRLKPRKVHTLHHLHQVSTTPPEQGGWWAKWRFDRIENLVQAVESLSSLPKSLPVKTLVGSGEFPQQGDQANLVQTKHLEMS